MSDIFLGRRTDSRTRHMFDATKNILLTTYILIAGCTPRKELEAAKAAAKEAQKDADMFKTYMIIAIALAVVGVVVFLVVGNMMGSKTRRDYEDSGRKKDGENGR